jgi:hypothetical protein
MYLKISIILKIPIKAFHDLFLLCDCVETVV